MTTTTTTRRRLSALDRAKADLDAAEKRATKAREKADQAATTAAATRAAADDADREVTALRAYIDALTPTGDGREDATGQPMTEAADEVTGDGSGHALPEAGDDDA